MSAKLTRTKAFGRQVEVTLAADRDHLGMMVGGSKDEIGLMIRGHSDYIYRLTMRGETMYDWFKTIAGTKLGRETMRKALESWEEGL